MQRVLARMMMQVLMEISPYAPEEAKNIIVKTCCCTAKERT
jgi:hypothetical protein